MVGQLGTHAPAWFTRTVGVCELFCLAERRHYARRRVERWVYEAGMLYTSGMFFIFTNSTTHLLLKSHSILWLNKLRKKDCLLYTAKLLVTPHLIDCINYGQLQGHHPLTLLPPSLSDVLIWREPIGMPQIFVSLSTCHVLNTRPQSLDVLPCHQLIKTSTSGDMLRSHW